MKIQGHKRESNLVHTTCATTEMATRHENTSNLRNKKILSCLLQSLNVFIANLHIFNLISSPNVIKKTDLLILADDAFHPLLSSPLRTMLLSDNYLGANCYLSGSVLFANFSKKECKIWIQFGYLLQVYALFGVLLQAKYSSDVPKLINIRYDCYQP